MSALSFVWKSGLLLAPTFLLKGCVLMNPQLADQHKPRGETRMQREHTLQEIWRGRSFDTLVERFGSPALIMNVPYRSISTSVVVYGIMDNATKCIDAFTIVVHGETQEVVVADYFCR